MASVVDRDFSDFASGGRQARTDSVLNFSSAEMPDGVPPTSGIGGRADCWAIVIGNDCATQSFTASESRPGKGRARTGSRLACVVRR